MKIAKNATVKAKTISVPIIATKRKASQNFKAPRKLKLTLVSFCFSAVIFVNSLFFHSSLSWRIKNL